MDKINKLKLARLRSKKPNQTLVVVVQKDNYLKKKNTVHPYKPVSKPRKPGDGPKIKIK